MTEPRSPPLQPVTLAGIRAARERLGDITRVTPLIPLNTAATAGEIYLKLENLQSMGSFKLRVAGNFMLNMGADERRRGVFTASSGNFGIAVAWLAARMGMKATVVVPLNAPRGKLDLLKQHGAVIHKVPFVDWWDVILTHKFRDLTAVFVHADGAAAMEASGTIGLEILDQLPDVDTVLTGYGSGALSCGIAATMAALKPDVRRIACESEAAAPFAAAWDAGKPVDVTFTESFISGIGSTTVLPSMWPVVRELLNGSAVVSLQQAADAVRLLALDNHIVAEAAGAVPVAAALAGHGGGKTVCVVSGGNIGALELITLLNGEMPAVGPQH